MRLSLDKAIKQLVAVSDAVQRAQNPPLVVFRTRPGESRESAEARVRAARFALHPASHLLVGTEYGYGFALAGVTFCESPARHFAALHPETARRYRGLSGGRGAAKSRAIGSALILRALESPVRVLCCREFQKSIAESSHKLLSNLITALKLDAYFDVKQTSITTYNGSEFLFEGLHANTSKIRSLESIDYCWIEEAAHVSESSWEVLIPTVRNEGSEIWLNWNPELADSPTQLRFGANAPPDSVVIHVTWKDNPWFPSVLEKERAYCERVDTDAHAHIWGGGVRKASKAQIFAGKILVEAFEPGPGWDGPYFGVDFGFSADPSTMVKCWVHAARLYIEYEAYEVGVDIDKLGDLFAPIPGSKTHTVRADSSEPATISYLKQHGFPEMVGVQKWPESVMEGVKFLRQFEAVVIHPRCEHAQDEGRLYSYKVDRLTGDVLTDIVDKHNHIWDAIRYALAPLIRQGGAEFWISYVQGQANALSAATPAPEQSHWNYGQQTTPKMLERIRNEGLVVIDQTSPWHQK